RLTSRRFFTDLGDLSLQWTLSTAGRIVATGVLDASDLGPGETRELTVDAIAQAAEDEDTWFDLSAVTAGQAAWAPAGYELAHCQVAVAPPASAGIPALAEGTLEVAETDVAILIATDR